MDALVRHRRHIIVVRIAHDRLYFACCDFAKSGDDHAVLTLHEWFRTFEQLAGPLGRQVNELVHVINVAEAIFNRNACHGNPFRIEV